MTKHFVIFGPPGSGKGTQARRLVRRFGFEYVGTGDLMRAEVEANTDLGKKFKPILEGGTGKLVDDQSANAMVDHRLEKLATDRSAIFDGYPRTVQQAEHLDEYLDEKHAQVYVLNLEVDFDSLLKRTSTRRICDKCRKTFQNPAQLKITQCDECGGKLIVRADDKPEVAKNRLEVYNKQTKPLLDFYKTQGHLISIDGNPPIDEVFDEIEFKVELILSQP